MGCISCGVVVRANNCDVECGSNSISSEQRTLTTSWQQFAMEYVSPPNVPIRRFVLDFGGYFKDPLAA